MMINLLPGVLHPGPKRDGRAVILVETSQPRKAAPNPLTGDGPGLQAHGAADLYQRKIEAETENLVMENLKGK